MSTISVVKLLDSWEMSISAAVGQEGVRKYQEVDPGSYSGGGTVVMLPDLGDKWDDEFPNCTCRSIHMSYAASESCGRSFRLEYSSSKNDGSQYRINRGEKPVPYQDLPVTMEMGCDLATWDPNAKSSAYVWLSDLPTVTPVVQPLSKMVLSMSIQITRIMDAVGLSTFTTQSFDNLGKLNNGPFYGFPKGMVLYQGASLSDYWDENGVRKFQVVLTFSAKRTTGVFGTSTDGWNYVIRNSLDAKNGKFDAPVEASSYTTGLYGFSEDNFELMFTVASPGKLVTDLANEKE